MLKYLKLDFTALHFPDVQETFSAITHPASSLTRSRLPFALQCLPHGVDWNLGAMGSWACSCQAFLWWDLPGMSSSWTSGDAEWGNRQNLLGERHAGQVFRSPWPYV